MTSFPIPITFPIPCSLFLYLRTERFNLGRKTLPAIDCCRRRRKVGLIHRNGFRIGCFGGGWPDLEESRRGRLVVVRANGGGSGFNGGGGGWGGWGKENTTRVLGNLAFAIGLTYLSMTGQLGWVLDAIVSIWLLAVALPIVGLGAFFWFAGRDIVQGSDQKLYSSLENYFLQAVSGSAAVVFLCPNCGNDFQIFKSSLKDGPQLCPFCTQPFSVQDNKFVRESAKFSPNQSSTFGQAFNIFSRRSEKAGKASSAAIVDIDAEVKDVD